MFHNLLNPRLTGLLVRVSMEVDVLNSQRKEAFMLLEAPFRIAFPNLFPMCQNYANKKGNIQRGKYS